MNLLLVASPANQSYVNLCYRYVEVGEVCGFLENRGSIVTVLDGIYLEEEKWEMKLYRLAIMNDAVIFYNTGDNIPNVLLYAESLKRMYPDLPIITYGSISTFNPRLFMKACFDGIVVAGDWEIVLYQLIEYILKKKGEVPAGSAINFHSEWKINSNDHRIPASEWAFPDLKRLPLDDYRAKYREDIVIAGKPKSFELSLSVSRGCPYNCWFCPSMRVDGNSERRRTVSSVIDFINKAIETYNFDQISFFSACFTLNREWVLDFCNNLISNHIKTSWRCVSTLEDLDPEMIEQMAKCGCWKIGIGVETFNETALAKIKKRVRKEKLINTLQWCKSNNVEVLCFLIDGLPGVTANDVNRDADFIQSIGAKVRIAKLINYNDIPLSDVTIENYKKKVTYL